MDLYSVLHFGMLNRLGKKLKFLTEAMKAYRVSAFLVNFEVQCKLFSVNGNIFHLYNQAEDTGH